MRFLQQLCLEHVIIKKSNVVLNKEPNIGTNHNVAFHITMNIVQQLIPLCTTNNFTTYAELASSSILGG
ncbi:hypothetical protein [Candidatus Nitrosocosmicus arcticus]|uniref:hypothetical protein n=1 Tax=Candidatus Nitrosocosmicus arcticus TaxID=2035267 RepID=UPI00119E6583|nr:hypothetical protein [Candidatus Nitrosocosmicus arcticus]